MNKTTAINPKTKTLEDCSLYHDCFGNFVKFNDGESYPIERVTLGYKVEQQYLWRVEKIADFKGNPLRHVSWHSTHNGVSQYIKESKTKGHEIVSIKKFVQVDEGWEDE